MKSAKPITPMGESLFIRILLALPLLGLFFIARTVLTTNISKCMPLFEEAMKIKFINDTGRKVPLRKTYSGLEGLDGFLGIFVAFFTPALAGLDQTSTFGPNLGEYGKLYAPQRLQSITFLADVTAVNAILFLESCRPGNSKTLASIPTIFLLAMQFVGGGQIAPLFYFLTYITLSQKRFTVPTSRHVPARYAKTLLPALMFGYIIPSIGSFYSSFSLSSKQAWNFIWQLFPVWIPAFHFLFSRFVSDKSAGSQTSSLRLTYLSLFVLSTSTYIYVFLVSPVPFSQLFFADISIWDWDRAISSISEVTGIFLKWDEIFVVIGTAYWMMLNVRDLKREGKMEASWLWILVVFGSVSLLCGPGAGMVVMWWWREEVLCGKQGKRE